MRWLRVVLPCSTFFVVAASACSHGIASPVLADADLRVLFIGNSLTYTHDVPALVASLARAHGRSLAQASLTAPDMSLEDHWHAGAADQIRRLRADVVILQQGPSSLPQNRDHLVHWSRVFAEVIREAGGIPALYMVWPSHSLRESFPAVMTSYETAASAVQGRLMPVGMSWVKAWELDASLDLYGADGFHPSRLGAFAAALTIYAVLFDVAAAAAPTPASTVTAAERAILDKAVTASLADYGIGAQRIGRWRAPADPRVGDRLSSGKVRVGNVLERTRNMALPVGGRSGKIP